MADPIMDLFDDTPLFNLDALPDDAFTDPVEEALKLALGQVDPPSEPTPDLSTPALSIPVAAPTIPDPVPVQQPAPVPVALPQTVSTATTVPQTTLSVASNTSGAATVLLGSPLTVNSSTGTTQHITTQQFTTQQLTQIAQQLTPQQLAAITQQAGGQGGAKIVILKGPGGQAQVLQTVAGTGSQAGKVTFARVLSGTQLRPGMQILSGGTVLNQASPGQGQVKVGTGVQRLVQSPNGPLKQVQLISIPQGQSQSQTQTVQVQIPQAQLAQAQAQVQLQTQGQATQIQLQPQTQVQLQSAMQTQVTAAATGTTTVRPQGVTLTTVPQQGEAKRITLVLQQPQGGAAQGGAVTVGGSGQLQQGQQQRLVLGNLPGKLVLQGGQLAALTQARAGQTGAQPKVLTIQLQVQQQPNQQGGPKFQLVSGGQGSSPQVVQISQGQGGQRLAVPLKLLLQPQTSATSTAGRAVSVVKVINTSAAGSAPSTTTTMSSPGIRLAKAQEPVRRLETLCKQEKANRIVAEAIARAKARGERNIPRVLNQDELPAGQKAAHQGAAATTTGMPGAKKKGGGNKKKSPAAAAGKGGAGAEKKGKAKAAGGAAGGTPGGAAGTGCSKSKSKAKINTITLVGGKKRKRNASSDHSDGELSPTSPSKALEEDMLAKRRSNRQVKRKKYTEDLDIKITDDEDEPEEDVDVTTTTAAVASITGGATGQLMGEQLKQELQLDGDSLSSMQFFVENPNEEDAAIVDKVLSMRLTKKEVSPGHYINAEEFFVKYKNYSYMHCEWATLEQLERDKRIHQKLKRFKAKHAQMRHLLQEEEEPFNPDYVEVDRILDESNSVDNGEPVVYYLVKWCSLPYEDATWELREDVDEGKVEEFRKIQDRQPQLKRTPRPQAAAWKKLEEFREYKSGNVLREYQLEGVNWLLFNWYNRQNCILADEMGLGKTIQSISLLSEVFGAGVQGPFLVIAPLSTITNWEREFATWTDMNAIVYHGSLASRQMIQQYEMYCKDDKDHLIPGAYKFDALITTFEMILSDCPELREISWRCVIIDEAHRLKNRNCKLLDSLKMLDLEHKVLLTGTPLQNTVEELFSLLHFLEPAQFSSESEFLRDFGDLKTEEQVQKLQAILKPMMLRRLKEDVEKNLAPKQETIIEVELTDVQKKYYRAILERNFSFLSMGATSNSNVPNLLNTMMELRKCCNHPYLITGAEEKIVAELRDVYDPVAPDFHLQALVRSAGKLVLLDKLLPRLKAGGHKVLIFSQMVRCLDILEDYLINKRYLYERIDGRVRGNLRQAAIDRFSKPDSDRFVFLLCTRAGGLGINLTAADTCVIFDSDWNPQNDLQAQARCHRIGQSKAVKVYRLITRNSYEREMLDKASLKLGLDRAVLQSMSGSKESNVNGQIQQFSKKEIEDLLRKGAYAAIMDEEDEGSKFCEEDIDQILQRRATTITIESEGKGSTFSKASFVATENRTDIALDDPEFWQKWAKRADIDFDSMNRKNTLVIDTPRVRKQTRQFATLRGEGGEISDPDSDDEYPPANSRQSRSSRRSERHTGNGYGRTDCFRVEKHLLVYGWGRWRDILSHARCKRRLGERDVETICRVILVFCLLHYRGDENIKSFIWELITPPENGREPHTLLNHSGLSIPVPRGRKGKRVKAQSSFDVQKVEWIRKYNPDSLLLDDSYRKHLKHQCNKVLLRVRMLYYLRQEVIGEHAESVLRGADARDIDIWMPEMEQLEVPSGWWDTEADRSLLVGVFKHGYEMYTTMRADDCLCFLERAGRPDDQAIDAEQHSADAELGDGGDDDKYSEDPEFKPALRHTKDLYEEADSLNMDDDICVEDKAGPVKTKGPPSGQSGACEWPTSSSLTARLRRLITAYQRSYRREQLKVEAAEKGDRRRRRCEQASKLKEIARQERQQRWTRREECDFYRVVSTFGVERIKKEADAPEGEEAELEWARFRTFARLEKKTDESLSRYFRCFMAMCRRVCNLRPARGEDPSELGQSLAPITEERASRTLYRISLLRRLREHVLPHPSLEELLLLAPPSSELPAWWNTPAHDRELMLGSALHGVSRTELSVFLDPQFSFSQARHDYLENQQNQPAPATPLLQPQAEEGSVVKEDEGLDKESRILGASEALGHSDTQITPLSRPDGKGRARTGLGWKKSRGRGPRSGGSKGERSVGGISDSDSDSDSGSSTSSQRSGSSDDSGDSDTERERAALKMEEDGENSLLSMTPSQDGAPPESLTDPFRVDWPKDRVLINRLDSLCTLVLSGQWPTGRRNASDTQLNPGSDDLGAGDELSFARLMRKGNSTPGGEGADGQESEFTVKLLKEEGLKLTFSKHALMSNGSGGEGSGRRKRRDQELSDPDGAVPVVDAMTGTVLSGERAPRRRDLPNWLKENPDYEVEGDMLELLVNRKRRRRKKRTEKTAALSGSEKVKIIDMRTGKKVGAAYGPMLQDLREFLEENPDCAVAPEWAEMVQSSGFLPDSLFHRLLSARPVIPKRVRHRHHHHHAPQSAPLEDPVLGGGEETLVSDGAYMMEDEDLENSPFLTQAFDVKMEGGDSLSQGGYESSDREALLDDVIMAQKDSDSSSSSED
ncbi:chromodomain-helicase-DNA-binding protein 8 isoform X1 [Salmo trutta]|uniref:chromodomain-helicase-DNA-binding protein 8 isoform X1 n=1 Tax=Salmo trutta TaxID=8032 RepID=UPI001131B2A6|nr:chromodomain-helicase-DNA-binding protein 8-like isoform X1 [Salmo trutta]XP_029561314.1 chromodomain-helicase-DNA-binding protein 8-like isoform X1 [Salmo trutta]XP_029561315.1 chromodomain-helicase-DNA-binding protein 8-like isoform X1 [Salmo trutta]